MMKETAFEVGGGKWEVGGETFDFEKLQVYQRSIEFSRDIFEFCDKLPYRLQSSLGDQLRRASLSVCHNLAEGSDKKSAKEKVLFYRYSLSSARECIPGLTLARMKGVLSAEDLSSFRAQCLIIGKMLGRLIESVSAERRP
jgi:four helix bundle protein